MIVYKLDAWSRDLNFDFSLKDCLFGGVKLTDCADSDKYVHSGYGIGFELRTEFSLPEGSVGKNVIISGADMSLSVHIDNKGKDILILSIGPTQGLNDTTLTVEAKYLRLHYNGSNRFFFLLMLQKYINSKQKILK